MTHKLSIFYLFINLIFTASLTSTLASDFSNDSLSYFQFKSKLLQDRVVSDVVKLPEQTDLILAYDFTSSNAQTGIKSFGGKNLHHLYSKEDVRHNPYQTITKLLVGNIVADEREREFHVLGFGDEESIEAFEGVNLLRGRKKPVVGLYGILKAYRSYRKKCYMSGPTSFAGPIQLASQQASENKKHTLLVIMTDGALSPGQAKKETIQAMVSASNTPLSILIIGIGDGTEREGAGLFPGLTLFKELGSATAINDYELNEISTGLKFDNVDFVNANDYLGGLLADQDPNARLDKFLKACVKKLDLQREFMEENGLI